MAEQELFRGFFSYTRYDGETNPGLITAGGIMMSSRTLDGVLQMLLSELEKWPLTPALSPQAGRGR